MIYPISKYVSQDYRLSLQVDSAPQMIDTDIPVLPVLEIQKGLPKPNSRQKLRYVTIIGDGTTRYLQMLTKSSTKRIFLIGYNFYNATTTAANAIIYDATSGNPPSLSANTVYDDDAGHITQIGSLTIQAIVFSFSMPIEILKGVRVQIGGATQSSQLTIYYLEENIN